MGRSYYLTATVTKNNYAPPQPPVVLQRVEGGYLTKADIKTNDGEHAKALTLGVLRKINECKGMYSKRHFENEFGGKKNIFGTSTVELRGVLNRCVEDGFLKVAKDGRESPLLISPTGLAVLETIERVAA